MENKRIRIIFYFVAGIFILGLCFVIWQWPKADMRVVVPVALIVRLAIEFCQVRIIAKRSLSSEIRLGYKISLWNTIFTGLAFIFIFVILFTLHHFSAALLLPLLSFSSFPVMMSFLTRRKIARYVVTEDKIIENGFWPDERKISDLHSIESSGIIKKIRIRFSDQYDIRIIKSDYSEAELAAFLQAVLDHSDIEAELDPAIQELLSNNQAHLKIEQ
ncbi:MAG TPA: hypothetical protein VK826_04290 [Bacteroidia bacterium]|nr:hypothetical protein [Bacteroidia bacterium]